MEIGKNLLRMAAAAVGVAALCVSGGCGAGRKSIEADKGRTALMEERLQEYVATLDARVGVAVILDSKDTVEVNGGRDFPMMSVFKFPVALAVADVARERGINPGDTIDIAAAELLEDTYSPMLKKYGRRNLRLPLREVLEWSLIESDNNACDVLIRFAGGTDSVMSRLSSAVIPEGIVIGVDEAGMHENPYLSYLNRSTPLAMASLFDSFYGERRGESEWYAEIAGMMERCQTGLDRLAAPLRDSGAVIGHKTGTGFDTPQGGISAVNDCGYISFPDGGNCAVAVFVADSPRGVAETSRIIARISEIIVENRQAGRVNPGL